MKFSLLAIVLFLSLSAVAQLDPGTEAAIQASQQAAEASRQAAEDNMRAAQAATQQTMQDLSAAAQNNSTAVVPIPTMPPSFSMDSGKVSVGSVLRLTGNTRYSVIYYTTDGWTPTVQSQRYEGPIVINASTTVKAIAVAPNMLPSRVASKTYKVYQPDPRDKTQPAPAPATPPLVTNGVLQAGTTLQLVIASKATSKTAQIGDTLLLALNQDVMDGGRVALPKGTPVSAVITMTDHSQGAGVPGELTFEVRSLNYNGRTIPLAGGQSLEGDNHYGTNALVIIPVVGLLSLAHHGDEAVLTPGMTLTASVLQDTPLQP